MNIDTSDYRSMLRLMDRADEFDSVLSGMNDDGGWSLVSIRHDSVTIKTESANPNIALVAIYHRNGDVEELYEKL